MKKSAQERRLKKGNTQRARRQKQKETSDIYETVQLKNREYKRKSRQKQKELIDEISDNEKAIMVKSIREKQRLAKSKQRNKLRNSRNGRNCFYTHPLLVATIFLLNIYCR